MKFGKLIFILLAFSFVFVCPEIHAQDSKQIKILNNYGSIPFEDDKTIVVGVKFTGLTAVSESEISKVLQETQSAIKVGDNFSGGRIAKAVKVIRERLGFAGYYKAEVAAFGEVVSKSQMKLNFVIEEGSILRVSEVRFEGNVNVSNEELFNNFKECIKDNWEIFNPQKYQYITRKCSLSLLYSRGFFQARIGQITPLPAAGNNIVTVEIKEGARFRNGAIRVEGAKALTEKEILEMLGVKKGDVSDGRYLIDFVYEKLKRTYADKGYVLYNAEFEPVFIEPAAAGADGIVNLLIKIDEGSSFKLSKIDFSGVEQEKAQQLRKLFSIGDGETYNQSKIEEGIKKINDLNTFNSLNLVRDIEIRTDERSFQIELVVKLTKTGK